MLASILVNVEAERLVADERIQAYVGLDSGYLNSAGYMPALIHEEVEVKTPAAG